LFWFYKLGRQESIKSTHSNSSQFKAISTHSVSRTSGGLFQISSAFLTRSQRIHFLQKTQEHRFSCMSFYSSKAHSVPLLLSINRLPGCCARAP
jgi:hypothetical protein